jgi:hypothetical protein
MEINTPSLKEVLSKQDININDLLKLCLKAIKLNFSKILIINILILILCNVLYLLKNIEYESKAEVLISQKGPDYSAIGGMGGLLGVNAPQPSFSSDFSPELYEDIVLSDAFLNDLLVENIPINEFGKDSTTLEIYLNNVKPVPYYKSLKFFGKASKVAIANLKVSKNVIQNSNRNSLVDSIITPGMLFSVKVPPIVKIGGNRLGSISNLKSRILVNFEDKICKVSVKMPDGFISAITCQLVLKKLIDYITYQKTHKQQNNIRFLESRYSEAESNYKLAQQRLAGFRDNSLGVIFQSFQAREQFLNNDVSLTFGLFNQIATQLEQAKIELKKETPVFSFFKSINLPDTPASNGYFRNMALYLLLGMFLTAVLVIRTLIKI